VENSEKSFFGQSTSIAEGIKRRRILRTGRFQKYKFLDPYVLHAPKSNDLCDKGRLIKETFIAISHTFSRDTTNPHLPFVPIPIPTHPT
jgi:hypothetical protein